MAEFVAFEPQVEVFGHPLVASIAAMGDEAQPYLAKHGLDHIDPNQWYKQQDWLDFLKSVSQKEFNSMFDLVSIGVKTPETAIFPDFINSIPSALTAIDQAYEMNHRGGKIGHYHATILGENSIDVLCENPYPCQFDYGLIYGLVRRFRGNGIKFRVQHDDNLPCRQKGGESCTYHVTWG